MKKILHLLLLAGMAGCFGKQPTITTGLEGKLMPNFNLLLMDSTTRINTGSIPTGKPVVLFLFSPFCPYCRAQTEEIIHHRESLGDVRLYMISAFHFTTIKSFYDHYQLNKFPNITLGWDDSASFNKYFHAQYIPYLAIYDKDKRLKQVIVGNVRTKEITDVTLK